MIQACVAERYDVQFVPVSDEDTITDVLVEADELDYYEQLIISRTSSDEMLELDKVTLESMLDDPDVSDGVKKTIQDMINQSDPDVDFVHIEFLEVL